MSITAIVECQPSPRPIVSGIKVPVVGRSPDPPSVGSTVGRPPYNIRNLRTGRRAAIDRSWIRKKEVCT